MQQGLVGAAASRSGFMPPGITLKNKNANSNEIPRLDSKTCGNLEYNLICRLNYFNCLHQKGIGTKPEEGFSFCKDADAQKIQQAKK